MWDTQVQSLGQEDPLEKGMVTHSSILAWKIPWMEEPGRLQSKGLKRVRHTTTHTQIQTAKMGKSPFYCVRWVLQSFSLKRLASKYLSFLGPHLACHCCCSRLSSSLAIITCSSSSSSSLFSFSFSPFPSFYSPLKIQKPFFVHGLHKHTPWASFDLSHSRLASGV